MRATTILGGLCLGLLLWGTGCETGGLTCTEVIDHLFTNDCLEGVRSDAILDCDQTRDVASRCGCGGEFGALLHCADRVAMGECDLETSCASAYASLDPCWARCTLTCSHTMGNIYAAGCTLTVDGQAISEAEAVTGCEDNRDLSSDCGCLDRFNLTQVCLASLREGQCADCNDLFDSWTDCLLTQCG